MARPKNEIPQYKRHSPSDAARCWVDGRWVTLGRYNSPESRAEYARLLAERKVVGPAPAGTRASIDELILSFWRHAEVHYRRADGTPTNELPQFRQTFRLLRGLYGHTPADDFGPLALKAVVRAMVDAGWCRKLVNQRLGRVKRLFKWAASEQLVPAAVWQALATVPGLQPGRTAAAETGPVRPVDEAHVAATLPFLGPAVRAMVEVQLLTGMRPGEVCRLRPADLDTTGAVWLYRPTQYKSRHRGKDRVIAIGPKAQAALLPFVPATPEDYFFSPRRSVAEFHRRRSASRTTARPLKAVRSSAGPAATRRPGDAYSVTSFGRAVGRAIDRANRAAAAQPGTTPAELPHWHPNQLRHTHGTLVRRRYGLEDAQVALGHARANVTQVYAEKNLGLAARIAEELG